MTALGLYRPQQAIRFPIADLTIRMCGDLSPSPLVSVFAETAAAQEALDSCFNMLAERFERGGLLLTAEQTRLLVMRAAHMGLVVCVDTERG